MPKLKYIGGGERDVKVPGFDCRVTDGDIIDAPDFQPDGVSALDWGQWYWEPVTGSKTSAKVDKILNVTSDPAKGK